MPTHKIHLAIAKKVNETLNLDLDSIMLGSVLPDICLEKDHTLSHYQNGKLGIDGTANPDLFIEKYKEKLSNPIMMGFLIHLLTDKFFNTFLFENFYIYDENGNDIGLRIKGKATYLPFNEIKDIKHRECSLYDYYLINHGYVARFKSFDCINNVVNIDEATFDKEKLKNYIISSNKDLDKTNILNRIRSNFVSYKLTTKKEMDRQFNLCCEYIINYIEKWNR